MSATLIFGSGEALRIHGARCESGGSSAAPAPRSTAEFPPFPPPSTVDEGFAIQIPAECGLSPASTTPSNPLNADGVREQTTIAGCSPARDSRERPALSYLADHYIDECLPGDEHDWRIYYTRDGAPLAMAPFDEIVGWEPRELQVVGDDGEPAVIAWNEPTMGLGPALMLDAAAHRLGLTLSELLHQLQQVFTVASGDWR